MTDDTTMSARELGNLLNNSKEPSVGNDAGHRESHAAIQPRVAQKSLFDEVAEARPLRSAVGKLVLCPEL